MKTLVLIILLSITGAAEARSPVQARIDRDLAAGKPIVVQVSVALVDNKHQWIPPVPEAIGNGQDAASNLYWGARYGLKTWFIKDKGWIRLEAGKPDDKRILERLVLKRKFRRQGRPVTVYLVADAWDGRHISAAVKDFYRHNGGNRMQTLKLDGRDVQVGGNAHLVVYVGHNALGDYLGLRKVFFWTPGAADHNPVNDSIVLACKSLHYFSPGLEKLAARPLLMTTGSMAPEAYTLHDAIARWVAGDSDREVQKAAAKAYDRFQKTGIRGAERLFNVDGRE